MWYAAGNTSSYEMAARYGLGVLGFSVGSIDELKPVLEAYKREVANAEPIGAFVNDNVMVTAAAFVAEDREDAVRSMTNGRLSYLQSNVFRYHDTFPRPDWAPAWPELIPDPTIDEVREQVGASGMVVGDPDDALTACQEWADAGADQLVFGQGMATQEEALETIRLIGEHVIPKIDKDPEHRTTRLRREAGAKI
jgi:alkanesulfonate monooxygenase SsuD/methylene tetrahydromethanopterin reductase-like flavin-dependent oxidoreductase (luciferase family)